MPKCIFNVQGHCTNNPFSFLFRTPISLHLLGQYHNCVNRRFLLAAPYLIGMQYCLDFSDYSQSFYYDFLSYFA
jgi:hypothetical protein